MRERIGYLDNAKGLLIILMVIAHIFVGGYVFDLIFNFHMMAFFFISGLLLSYTNTAQRPFVQILRSRLVTMGVPFLFFELWGVALRILVFEEKLSAKGYVYNTLSLNFNNGAIMWFLVTLFFAEMLFFSLHKLTADRRIQAAVSVLLFFVSLLIPTENPYLDYLGRILRAVFFLNVGYFLGKQFSVFRLPVLVISLLTLLLLTWFNGRIGFAEVTLSNCVFFLLTSFSGIYLTLSVAQMPLGKWLSILGKNTMTIYCTHFAYYVFIGKLLGNIDMGQQSFAHRCLIFLLVALLEIPTIYLFNRFFPILVGKKRRPSTSHTAERRDSI